MKTHTINFSTAAGKWSFLLAALMMVVAFPSKADLLSARTAMEDQTNPLLLVTTSAGPIYLELFPTEAPANVSNFIAIAEGSIDSFDGIENRGFTPGYYEGVPFHRVIPGFVIQAGSYLLHPLGRPNQLLDDEINASALGLDREPILSVDGSVNPMLNVGNQTEFADRILQPLYAQRNIDSLSKLTEQQYDVAEDLQALTVMRLYEIEGYQYQNQFATRGIMRGTLGLANDGPNRNGPEFFIALRDAEWLSGRYTVIGRVVEGMEIADQIGASAVNPLQAGSANTVIYSVRRMN
ncbi:MAG: peptidylprolyl isomerase [Gammaproteobacteria bacterium]